VQKLGRICSVTTADRRADEDRRTSDAEAVADRLMLAVSAAKAAVFEIDVGAQRVWCSDDFIALVGRVPSDEEVRSARWTIHHPDDVDRVAEIIADARAHRWGQAAFESRVLLPSGELKWIDWRTEPRFDRNGRRCLLGVAFDITERKIAEEKLRLAQRAAEANAERLEMALLASGGGVFDVDYVSRTFWCSPEYERVVGRRLTFEEISAPMWWFTHPDDRERVLAHIAQAQHNIMTPVEWRVVLPDGGTRWVLTNGRAHGAPGERPTRVVGYIQDIDERKRAEIALEEARFAQQETADRLELAVNAVDAGIFELNVATGEVWNSPRFVEIMGRPLTYDEAMQVWPMLHPDDTPRLRQGLEQARATAQRTARMEARVVLPSGETRWIDGHLSMHRDAEGGLTRLVAMVMDADARKTQELSLIAAERAASAAAEAKAQFLANMSHEIRTPMNGVLGILHLLGREPLTDEAQRLVAEAEGCGQMLAQLLDDVIDFSKVEAGRLELAPVPTDTAAVLDSVAELLRPQAESKGVALRTLVAGDDAWAMIDPVRLRQGLFNLIGNAIKFTHAGHVEARLTVRETFPGCKRLRFEIEDTGVGIPAALQDRLFQRFQQADGSTARQFGGSGLGLAITRALVEMMGGKVGFTSEEGRGSTFWIDIETGAAAGQTPSAPATVDGLGGLRILVVEDNATNRLVATKILQGLGASVETAEDGLAGVAAVAAGGFDLVLMDIQMPRMDGVEATRTIRALSGDAGATPIIGLTANVLPEQWRGYRAAGMNGVVGKPISPPALLAEIARVADGAEPEAAHGHCLSLNFRPPAFCRGRGPSEPGSHRSERSRLRSS
jgi:PAS domain S-box-containing protein